MFIINKDTKIKCFYDDDNYNIKDKIKNFIKNNTPIKILKILKYKSSPLNRYNFSITLIYEEI